MQNLPDHERERQLWGNWYARPKGSNYFDRGWIQDVHELPQDVITCRAWDFAAKESSEVYKHPDLTASICISKSKDGYYYLHGDYIEENHCIIDHKRINGGIRKLVGDRDNIVIEQAKVDGDEIPQVLPVDPGSAGLTAYEATAKRLTEEGIIVRKDPMPSNKSKLTRFLPFSAAAQNGLVKIVSHTFGNRETYGYIMKMLEAFDGERSTDTRKDDFPDCIASGFNYISRTRGVVTAPSLPSLPSIGTKMSELRVKIGR